MVRVLRQRTRLVDRGQSVSRCKQCHPRPRSSCGSTAAARSAMRRFTAGTTRRAAITRSRGVRRDGAPLRRAHDRLRGTQRPHARRPRMRPPAWPPGAAPVQSRPSPGTSALTWSGGRTGSTPGGRRGAWLRGWRRERGGAGRHLRRRRVGPDPAAVVFWAAYTVMGALFGGQPAQPAPVPVLASSRCPGEGHPRTPSPSHHRRRVVVPRASVAPVTAVPVPTRQPARTVTPAPAFTTPTATQSPSPTPSPTPTAPVPPTDSSAPPTATPTATPPLPTDGTST